jgi:hypothetical protein
LAWQSKIAGCFSGGHFAGHALEEERAFELLKQLRSEGVGWKEVKLGFKGHIGPARMAIKTNGPKELKKVEQHFRPWILD